MKLTSVVDVTICLLLKIDCIFVSFNFSSSGAVSLSPTQCFHNFDSQDRCAAIVLLVKLSEISICKPIIILDHAHPRASTGSQQHVSHLVQLDAKVYGSLSIQVVVQYQLPPASCWPMKYS